MKQQVDKLIANLLLDEGEIYLPKVGTLILCRHAAELQSSKILLAPYRELRLTREERGVNIATHISRIAIVSTERANDIYTEWLDQSLRNDILTIEGVCSIEKGNISTDKTFEDMVNPQGRKKIKVNPRTNYFIYVVAGLCMGFALGIAGYILHTNGTLDKLFAEQYNAPVIAESCEVTPQPIVEEVVEQPAEQPVIELQAAEPQTAQEPETPAMLQLKKGSSYAVWGVYNELQNAENAVAWLATRVPNIDSVNIYDYDGRYMVALCETASRSECGRKVSAWKAEHTSFKSVWVYTR